MIPIVIPTYKREHKQQTLNTMPPELHKDVLLVTNNGLGSKLKDANPNARVWDLGPMNGIADVRAKVCDVYLEEGYEKILMLDDAIRLHTSTIVPGKGRRPSSSYIRPHEGLDHWTSMLEKMEELLDYYPQVAISPRPGNNRFDGTVLECSRAYSCYGLNLKELARLNARFDGMAQIDSRFQVYEDFYLALSLLTQGVPNAIMYDYAFQQGHGNPGGCSTYRTQEVQRLCAEQLAECFPGYVKVVTRTGKSWGIEGRSGERPEVRISWKKAYTDAKSIL